MAQYLLLWKEREQAEMYEGKLKEEYAQAIRDEKLRVLDVEEMMGRTDRNDACPILFKKLWDALEAI